jgi:hypothetical protein
VLIPSQTSRTSQASPISHFSPERTQVKSGSQFVDLLRRVGNSGGVTPSLALTLRNRLNDLKCASRLPGEKEVGGPALTARAFSDTVFAIGDLRHIRQLRLICRAHGQDFSGSSEALKTTDFEALAIVACVDVAVRNIASGEAGTASGQASACRNLNARLNRKDSGMRRSFMETPLGAAVEDREKALIEWVLTPTENVGPSDLPVTGAASVKISFSSLRCSIGSNPVTATMLGTRSSRRVICVSLDKSGKASRFPLPTYLRVSSEAHFASSDRALSLGLRTIAACLRLVAPDKSGISFSFQLPFSFSVCIEGTACAAGSSNRIASNAVSRIFSSSRLLSLLPSVNVLRSLSSRCPPKLNFLRLAQLPK